MKTKHLFQVILSGALTISTAPFVGAADLQPNILFCFADDWGRYASVYASVETRPSINQVVKTPNIDRMARQGVLFKDTFVAFADMDASPTKAWLVSQYAEPQWQWHYDYAFAKRPAEELYDLKNDPDQTKNLAANPEFGDQKRQLAARLLRVLTDAKDPRVLGDGQTFERSPFTDAETAGVAANQNTGKARNKTSKE